MITYDLSEITDRITDYLAAQTTDLDVVSFPGDPSELTKPRSRRTIFVGLADVVPSPPKQQVATTRIQSLDTVSFELVLNWVDRRSLKGAVKGIQTVRDVLTGFHPIEGWERYLYMTRAGFVDFDRGTWVYSMRFELQIPYSKTIQSSD
jgi:Gp37 protein